MTSSSCPVCLMLANSEPGKADAEEIAWLLAFGAYLERCLRSWRKQMCEAHYTAMIDADKDVVAKFKQMHAILAESAKSGAS